MATPQDLDWTRDEIVLTVDIYNRYAANIDRDKQILRLSQDLRRLGFHPKESQLENHRSADAIGMMFQKFKALETKGQTSSREPTPLLRDIWEKYGGKLSVARTEANRIRGERTA